MYQVSLINMPFASLEMPSLALTQLRSVLGQRFGEKVRVRILYLSHDFVHFLGQETYMAMMEQARTSGLSEWFFRQVAFPQEEDNTQQYFQRYHMHLNEGQAAAKGKVLSRRMGLERFMRRLVSRYRLDGEDLVGFTSMFSQNLPSIALSRLIKDVNPKAVTVMGGANCEAPMGRELARCADPLDFVFSGPSLVSFPEFVGYQMEGEADKCHQIRGVFSKRNADSEFLAGRGMAGEELPIEVPVPLDYESFLQDLEKSFPRGTLQPGLPFETSRGCWWGERAHCTFCGLNGGSMAYRSMPPEMALDFLRDLMQRYGDRCKRYQSVDNIMPREYLKDVFPHLETPAGTSFFYEVKADLTAKDMEILSRAGVTEIQPGIESLNTGTLKLMKKGTTAFRNIAFLKNCVRFGLNPAWNLLIGFPREKEEVYKKYLDDIPRLPHLPPPSGAYPIRFDRYSPYFTQAEEYGLDLSPYDYYRFVLPFGEESLHEIAYHFEDRNYSSEYMSAMVAWQQKLNQAMLQWQQRWNASDGRPKSQLFLKRAPGGWIIHDTRFGELREYEPSDAALNVLALLDERGRRLADIARNAKISLRQAEDELAWLKERQLLFGESERYISLVVEGGQAVSDFQGAVLAKQQSAGIGLQA